MLWCFYLFLIYKLNYLIDTTQHKDGVHKHHDVPNHKLDHVKQDGLLVQITKTSYGVGQNIKTLKMIITLS